MCRCPGSGAVAAGPNASATASQSGYLGPRLRPPRTSTSSRIARPRRSMTPTSPAPSPANSEVNEATRNTKTPCRCRCGLRGRLQAAAVALAADLAAYGGDTASFDFEPFKWPRRRPRTASSCRTTPPSLAPRQLAPQYTGPQFNWQAHPGYQQAKALFEQAYIQFTQQANSTFDTEKRERSEITTMRSWQQPKCFARTLPRPRTLTGWPYKTTVSPRRFACRERGSSRADSGGLGQLQGQGGRPSHSLSRTRGRRRRRRSTPRLSPPIKRTRMR